MPPTTAWREDRARGCGPWGGATQATLRWPPGLTPERMREEEAQHFPRRIRSSRIGVGAGGTASRPCVAGTVNAPMLGNCPPARVGKDGTGIGMPAGHPSAKDLRCSSSLWRIAQEFGRRCSGAPWCRDRHGKRWSAREIRPLQLLRIRYPAAWRRTQRGGRWRRRRRGQNERRRPRTGRGTSPP